MTAPLRPRRNRPRPRVDVELLPSEVRTDEQVRAERLAAALAAVTPEFIRAAVGAAVDRVRTADSGR